MRLERVDGAKDDVGGDATLERDTRPVHPFEQSRVGGGVDSVSDPGDARELQRREEVRRGELAGVHRDAESRKRESLGQRGHRRPVRLFDVGLRNDVDTRETLPRGTQASLDEEFGARPIALWHERRQGFGTEVWNVFGHAVFRLTKAGHEVLAGDRFPPEADLNVDGVGRGGIPEELLDPGTKVDRISIHLGRDEFLRHCHQSRRSWR